MTEADTKTRRTLELADLLECGWKSALGEHCDEPLSKQAQALRDASTDTDDGKCGALVLLAEVLEMGLESGKPGGPYFPTLQLGAGRSFLPRDLNEHEVEALATFAEQVDHPPLAARLADMAWLHPKTKHGRYAKLAIESFTAASLTEQSWSRGQQASWLRAIHIAKELRGSGKPQLMAMLQRILDALAKATPERPKYLHDLAELLEQRPRRAEVAEQTAQAIEEVARRLDGDQAVHWTADTWQLAAQWWRVIDDDERAADCTSAAVDSKLGEASRRTNAGQGPALTTAPLYEEAIELLRSIPSPQRARLDFDNRIDDCRRRLRASQAAAVEHFHTISVEIPEAMKMAENARAAVRGKPAFEALCEFVLIHRVTPAAALLKQAEDGSREFLFSRLASSRWIANDGRTTAKVPALPFENNESAERSRALHADIVRNLSVTQDVTVKTGILPALWVLHDEHRLADRDFLELCQKSPVISIARRSSVAAGLHAGYIGNFRLALYLLVPQLEHLVRVHVQAHGGQTSTITDGVEQEKGLSALMEMPEAQKVFGEDLKLELYVLFCDPLGPNLRNQVAHGLLSDAEAGSMVSVYAWWFMLRLVLSPFLSRTSEDGGGDDSGVGDGTEEPES